MQKCAAGLATPERAAYGPSLMRFAPLALGALLALSAFPVACAPPKGSHDSEGAIPMGTQASLTMDESAALRAKQSVKTVWVIVMENHSWRDIHGNAAAPYINDTLLKIGAHAENYTNAGIHPSEPNYIWLEAGDDLDISDDDDPSANYRTTKNHLTNQLEAVGVSWRAFPEGIDGDACPVQSGGAYKAKHVPFVYFDDVTDGRNVASARCIEHVRPYGELLSNVGRYNFITPDQCHDMHDGGCEAGEPITNGDRWLSREIPKIMESAEYKDGGAIFVTWDEGTGDEDAPLGMIVLSPFAKAGYSSSVAYTHGSMLRTVQDIFAVRPYLRDAARAENLADLFNHFP
jgi:phosphatidylinositol-3-phosphatase